MKIFILSILENIMSLGRSKANAATFMWDKLRKISKLIKCIFNLLHFLTAVTIYRKSCYIFLRNVQVWANCQCATSHKINVLKICFLSLKWIQYMLKYLLRFKLRISLYEFDPIRFSQFVTCLRLILFFLLMFSSIC